MVQSGDDPQFVDPSLSRAKFDRELVEYRVLESEYRQRGWILVTAEFPEVIVILVAPQLSPPAIVTGVRFDYTNYDARPPSVTLIHPLTHEPYKASQLPTHLKRTIEVEAFIPPGFQLPPGAQSKLTTQQPLMQWYGPEEVPFLCLAGVREYHDHPGHSGDAWELHRKGGAGRLVRLLEVITTYGIKPINDYQIALTLQVNGFLQSGAPA